MDPIDAEIIKVLQNDGRASNAGIARKLMVSEGTVRRRLKKLVKDEFIQIIALPDPRKMGYESQALLGVQVEPDKIGDVANNLSGLTEVNWVAITTGTYDVFAWVTLSSAEALGLFLRNDVGTIPGVRKTETFVNLDKMRGHAITI